MGNILIIEDEVELAELIQLYLHKEGLDADCAETAEEGLTLVSGKTFDLIILDLNLPGMDGFQFLKQFRENSNIPVIIVSAREADEDIILGLGTGADEFVTKPFVPKVLTARVKAMLRRSRQLSDESRPCINFDDFVLDTGAYILKKSNKLIPLSIREFEVLSFMINNAGIILSPHEIYEKVWQQEFGEISAVGVYIQRIRKKIEPDYHNPLYIKTIHGNGYQFQKEVLNES